MKWSDENRYDATITQAIAAAGGVVPLAIVKAIIGAESAYNPRAYRAEVKINDASRGLMQVLYRTAKGVGYTGSAEGLFDPATSIHVGVKYLSDLVRSKRGDLAAAVSAYNNGNGKRATSATTVCLARGSQGECIRSFTAQPGQFFNQPYVDKVLGYAEYFGLGALGDDGAPGSGGGGAAGGWLVLAVLGALAFMRWKGLRLT
jgi:soluble lytic murein transglycosylase-like protein